jgi:hypothetical protein
MLEFRHEQKIEFFIFKQEVMNYATRKRRNSDAQAS